MSNVIHVDFRPRVYYRVGDHVHHKTFGAGTVVRVERAPTVTLPPVYVHVMFDGDRRPRILSTTYAVMHRVRPTSTGEAR